jgi:hypothetical protein
MTEAGQTKRIRLVTFSVHSLLSEAVTKTDAVRFGILNFGHCYLFGICYLEFVILI